MNYFVVIQTSPSSFSVGIFCCFTFHFQYIVCRRLVEVIPDCVFLLCLLPFDIVKM